MTTGTKQIPVAPATADNLSGKAQLLHRSKGHSCTAERGPLEVYVIASQPTDSPDIYATH